MINKNLIFKSGKAGFVSSALLLTALTGCVGYVNGPSAGVYVAPPVVEVVAPADYVYYPGYDVYFNSSLHQYAYRDGGVWVSRPEPRGVSIDVLMASPSVRMDFHDSPANHNEAMVRAYPRNWASPGARPEERTQIGRAPSQREQGQKTQIKRASAKAEKRDEHREK